MQKPRVKALCSVEGCNAPTHAKGVCPAHYTNLRYRGDPLAGSTATQRGSVRKFVKEVVLPYDGDRCIFWPFAVAGDGYPVWSAPDGQDRYVHRAICEIVHGPPPSDLHQAAHSCGNGRLGCVTKKHLRWATPKENCADKVYHETQPFGESVYCAKITARDALEIRKNPHKKSLMEFAQQYGISESAVSKVKRGKSWRRVR